MTIFHPPYNSCASLGKVGCGVCVAELPEHGGHVEMVQLVADGLAQSGSVFLCPGSSPRVPAHQLAVNQHRKGL